MLTWRTNYKKQIVIILGTYYEKPILVNLFHPRQLTSQSASVLSWLQCYTERSKGQLIHLQTCVSR